MPEFNRKNIKILGINCFCHDSSACLAADGKIIAAAEEERFNGIKHTSDFPKHSINYCLQTAGVDINNLDCIAISEKPYYKFYRVIAQHLISFPRTWKNFSRTMPYWLDQRLIIPVILKQQYGYTGKIYFIPHHLSHIASSYFCSPFNQASCLSSDGVGEFSTLTLGSAAGNKIKLIKELHYPNSLGLFYSAITSYLGYRANSDEAKIMALADFGQPEFLADFKKIISIKADGSFTINKDYLAFNEDEGFATKKFIKLFGQPKSKDELGQRDFNIAASAQAILEIIMVNIARELIKITPGKNLCLAGGTFLNCVLNSKILEESGCNNLFIQPAANDAGTAMGAALFTYHQLMDNQKEGGLESPYLGPRYNNQQIAAEINRYQLHCVEYKNSNEMLAAAAKKISQNKIIGWFQGRMEWGPRALGARSILANPADSTIKKRLNAVKKREWFQPFGVSILLEEANNFFNFSSPSPYMLLVGRAKSEKVNLIGSALHVNQTSRLQTVKKEENLLYYNLINEFFKLTGLPLLINTSFNEKNKPIVCNPSQAITSFLNMDIDCLFINNFLLEKKLARACHCEEAGRNRLTKQSRAIMLFGGSIVPAPQRGCGAQFADGCILNKI